MEKNNFLKIHADTIAIIGVNIAICAILVSLWIANASRIDSVNARMDATIALIHQESKDFNTKMDMTVSLIHQESKDFHKRLCTIEERNKG